MVRKTPFYVGLMPSDKVIYRQWSRAPQDKGREGGEI